MRQAKELVTEADAHSVARAALWHELHYLHIAKLRRQGQGQAHEGVEAVHHVLALSTLQPIGQLSLEHARDAGCIALKV